MSLENKGGRDYSDKPIGDLPEIPDLPSLTDKEKADLSEWWETVRRVLERADDAVRANNT